MISSVSSPVFSNIYLSFSLSVHRLHVFVCVCAMVKTWYMAGHGRASHNGNPGNSWPHGKSIYGLMTNPNQSVIRLCQVETSAQQIEMVPALNTGGYGRTVGELCGPGLPNCVWCYGVTVSPFRWLGFLLLNCFGVAFRIEHGSAFCGFVFLLHQHLQESSHPSFK